MSRRTHSARRAAARCFAIVVADAFVVFAIGTCRPSPPVAVTSQEAPPPASRPVSPEVASEPAPPSEPAEPAPAETSAPALQVAELTPERVGEEVRVEAQLRWVVTRCTRSVPPSCAGDWSLVDARGGKSPAIRLEVGGVALPVTCTPPTGALSPASPCPQGSVLDTRARYLLDGVLEARADGHVFVLRAARRIDGADAGPDSAATGSR